MFIKTIHRVSQLIGIFVTMFLSSVPSYGSDAGLIVVNPEEYPSALRNPLKGFRPDTVSYTHLTLPTTPYV